MAIHKIIFDVGQVLVNFSPKNLFLKILKTEQEVDYFLKIFVPGSGISSRTWCSILVKQLVQWLNNILTIKRQLKHFMDDF